MLIAFLEVKSPIVARGSPSWQHCGHDHVLRGDERRCHSHTSLHSHLFLAACLSNLTLRFVFHKHVSSDTGTTHGHVYAVVKRDICPWHMLYAMKWIERRRGMGFLLRGAFVKVSVNSHVCEGRLSITKRDVHFPSTSSKTVGKNCECVPERYWFI